MIKKIFYKLFGKKIRLVEMTEQREYLFYSEMAKILDIRDFWEYQKQKAYQLYAATNEKRFLGYADMAIEFLRFIEEQKKDRYDIIKEKEQKGYDSMIP